MADKDGLKVAKDYHTDVPFGNQGSFHVKGANNTDWGMKRHLSNIFDPVSGNTVMFAFDHGYFMGSTAGLERLDLVIPKLQEQVDVFMGTRGAIRTCVSPTYKKGIALRVTSGSSMINDDLSHECLAVDVEDAIRMNADCMAVQTFIGADGQLSSIDNLSRCINAGMRYSIPTLGVVAVGKDMELAPTASSSSRPVSWPRWACSSSRPITAITSRKSSPRARCRSLLRAARSCRRMRR